MKFNLERAYVPLAYLAIALLLFWKVSINPAGAATGTDPYLEMFYLWSAPHALLSPGQPAMFYPIGAAMPAYATYPLAGILSYPLQLVGIALAYNVIFILGYAAAGLFMYLLMLHLTKSKAVAFAAGIAFAFNPLSISQGSMSLVSMAFMPLLALSLIMLVRERKAKFLVAAIATVLFIIFFGSVASGLVQMLLSFVTGSAVGVALSRIDAPKRSERLNYASAAVVILVLMYCAYFALHENVVPASAPSPYLQLHSQDGNFSILFLPVLPDYNSSDPWRYQKLEAYYAATSGKPTINGYAPQINQSQVLLLTSIPLSVEANYLSLGQGFAYASPITENYTNVTLLWLAADNVGVVSVVRSAYNYSQLQQLLSYMVSTFGTPIYQDNSTSMFSTDGAVSAHAGKSIVAYPTGTWVPGYAIGCGSAQCPQGFANTWWGGDDRGIALFAPQNVSKIRMSMTAFSSGKNTSVYIFANDQQLTSFNIGTVAANYTFTVPVHAGYNYLIFAEEGVTNSTVANLVSTDYGIRNATFKAAT